MVGCGHLKKREDGKVGERRTWKRWKMVLNVLAGWTKVKVKVKVERGSRLGMGIGEKMGLAIGEGDGDLYLRCGVRAGGEKDPAMQMQMTEICNSSGNCFWDNAQIPATTLWAGYSPGI